MKNLLILPIVALLFFFSSCSNDDGNSNVREPQRTVLIYMAGENNLSAFADDDLAEIKAGSKSLADNQNLIVYVDQSSKKPYMARVKNGVLTDSVSMNETSTANPEVMEDVIRQVRSKYPAQSYGMVLWGHSSGWIITNDTIRHSGTRAYGLDNYPGQYWMNIPSMARAIANAMEQEKLAFILGDCCNFNSIEVAYELRNVAEYIIGSPAEIPDPGAPYQLIVPDMFSSSEGFYRLIIDHYYNNLLKEINAHPGYYHNNNSGDLNGYSVPLSAIKTSALEELAQATANLLNTIPEKLSPEGELDFNTVTCYAYTDSHKMGYDMSQTLKMNTSAAAYAAWEMALTKALVYKVYSQKWLLGSASLSLSKSMDTFSKEDASAVSMFFPQKAFNSTSSKWNTTIQQYQWNQTIQWAQYGW